MSSNNGVDHMVDAVGQAYMLIVTEFCSGGTLNERLNRPSNDGVNFKWMLQTCDALACLHSCNVIHCDLKLENVLLTNRNREDIKLVGFGLVRQVIALKQTNTELGDGAWTTMFEQYCMNSGAAPIHWVVPEFHRYERYNEKTDVFFLGCYIFCNQAGARLARLYLIRR